MRASAALVVRVREGSRPVHEQGEEDDCLGEHLESWCRCVPSDEKNKNGVALSGQGFAYFQVLD